MKVSEIRRKLGLRLQEAAMEKDPDVLGLALDYGRALLLALAPLEEQAEVDLSELGVNTATAAKILSFHVEYVRDLIRREILPATKRNNEYDIRLVDLVDFMRSPRYQTVGAPAAVATAALRRCWPVWRMPHMYRRPEEQPGSAT